MLPITYQLLSPTAHHISSQAGGTALVHAECSVKLLKEREFCHLGLDLVVFMGAFQLRISSDSVTLHDPGVTAQEEFLACASATL